MNQSKKDFHKLIDYFSNQDRKELNIACASFCMQLYDILRFLKERQKISEPHLELLLSIESVLNGDDSALKVTMIKDKE